MKCPECDAKTKVTKTTQEKQTTYRQINCLSCNLLFHTTEHVFSKGRRTNYVRWEEEDKCHLVKLREQGLTTVQLAEHFKRNPSSVYAKVEEMLETGEYFKHMDKAGI